MSALNRAQTANFWQKGLIYLSAMLLLVMLAVVLMITLSLTVIEPIAPWYDELWNLYPSPLFFGIDQNIWAGCGNAMCLRFFGHSIPILSGPYHGLIKTVVFSPFVVWGNLLSIRLLNLAVYLLPMIYLFFQRAYFGKLGIWVIASTYYLLVPSLLVEAIFDQGQFVFANGFLFIAALELVKYTKTHSCYSAALALLFSGLAVYEKLTNLPVAFVIGALAFFLLGLQKNYRLLVFVGLAGVLMLVPYAIFISKMPDLFFGMTGAPKASYIENFHTVTQGAYHALFANSITLNGFFNHSFVVPAAFVALALFLLCYVFALMQGLSAITSTASSASNPVPKRWMVSSAPIIGMLLLPALAVLVLPLFDGLNRPWHLYQLAPLLCIPVAYSCLLSLQNQEDAQHGRFGRSTPLGSAWIIFESCLLPALLIMGIVNLGALLLPTWNTPRVHPYESGLFSAAQTIRDQANQFPQSLPKPVPVVCLDYSICSNLVYLLGPQFKVLSDWSYSPIERICEDLERNAQQSYVLVTRVSSRKKEMTEYDQFIGGRTHYFEDHCSGTFKPLNNLSADNTLPNYRLYYHPE